MKFLLSIAVLATFLSFLPAQTSVRIQSASKRAFNSTPTNSILVANQQARLISVVGYNAGPDQWVFIFNTNTIQGANAQPTMPPIKVLSHTQFSVDYMGGKVMSSGIFIGNSTTPITLTNGANDFFYEVNFD